MSKVIVTQEGLRRLKVELEHIKNTVLPALQQDIKEQKTYGNVDETLLDQQRFYKKRITVLTEMIETAKVLEV